jgi:hypothetical protein
MKRTSILIPVVLITTLSFADTSRAAVSAARTGLLPTQMLARQVQALATVPETDADQRRRIAQGKAVRDRISDFIVRQLDALPSISSYELQHQLQSIVCTPGLTRPCSEDYSTPKVFTDIWGPKEERRQVVVAYLLYLGCMGERGSLVTLENYVWEKGSQKARMTTRGGSEFDGRYVEFQQFEWYPSDNQYWIFVSGPPLGWSGRAYAGSGTLYSVGMDQVRAIWTSGTLPNLRLQKNELGWEASYADSDRFYNNLPEPYVFDIYKFDYDSRKFQRVIHYRY